MKKIFLLLMFVSFNAMAADVFPGFESSKELPPAETESKSEKFGSDTNPELVVKRNLNEQRARAFEQKTIDNLKP
ncbi:MAG: hypothetical protein J6P93_03710 [Alphaproteobacteria bacterium]|nr:hypothetical protein [Alphaproteobacteria bacterium]